MGFSETTGHVCAFERAWCDLIFGGAPTGVAGGVVAVTVRRSSPRPNTRRSPWQTHHQNQLHPSRQRSACPPVVGRRIINGGYCTTGKPQPALHQSALAIGISRPGNNQIYPRRDPTGRADRQNPVEPAGNPPTMGRPTALSGVRPALTATRGDTIGNPGNRQQRKTADCPLKLPP